MPRWKYMMEEPPSKPKRPPAYHPAKQCRSCRYSTGVCLYGVDTIACGYILKAYRRRPCSAGDGCTVWEQREDNERVRQSFVFWSLKP